MCALRGTGTIALVVICLAFPAVFAPNAQTPQKNVPAPAVPKALEPAWKQPLTVTGALKLLAGDAAVFVASAESGWTAHTQDDGHVIWSSPHKSSIEPVASTGLIGSTDGAVVRVSRQRDGSDVWQATVDAAPTALFVFPEHLGAVVGSQLYTWRLDGAPRWRAKLEGDATTPVRFHNGTLFVCESSPALVAIDSTTGAVRSRIKLPARADSLATTDDRIFLGADDRKLYAYRIAGTPRLDWRRNALRTIGQATTNDRRVFFALRDNSVRAFSQSGGSQHWAFVPKSRPVTGPLRFGTTLAIVLRSGQVLELDPANGRLIAPEPAIPLADVSVPAAVASLDGSLVFTVTTTGDVTTTLTAWGHPKPKR